MGLNSLVIEELAKGRKTRQELRETLHATDREIRRAIADLRKTNYPNICSSAKSGGYWLGTKKEALMTARELQKKAKELQNMSLDIYSYATCHSKDKWCDECKWKHICEERR